MPETKAPAVVRRERRGKPLHEPTKVDRDTVTVMVAGGIAQVDIASARGISLPTLRLHYRAELDNGANQINTVVLIEHLKCIKAGDFAAIKWWEQARCGWSEKQHLEHSGQIGLRDLTDEQRDARIAELLRKTGAAGAS
jgi:hypothetical protein